MNTGNMTFEQGVTVGAGGVLALLVVLLLLGPWLRAMFSGGALPLATIIGIRLRGNPVYLLIDTHLALLKSGEVLPFPALEAAFIKHRSQVRRMEDLINIIHSQYATLINKMEGTSNKPPDATSQ